MVGFLEVVNAVKSIFYNDIIVIRISKKQFYGLRKVIGLPRWLSRKESACSAGDVSSTPGSGRSSGEGNGNPLQYSCLGNPMDRGAWWAPLGGKELDMT